jgi:hypothetical protein
MRRWLYIDAAKVNQDVAYVAMVVHICCKGLLPMFNLYFWMYVASVFIWMLHMFHTYVACVLSECCVCLQMFSSVFRYLFKCFRSMLEVCVSNVSVIFRHVAIILSECFICCSGYIHMLQTYILNVSFVLDVCCSKSSMLQVFHEA